MQVKEQSREAQRGGATRAFSHSATVKPWRWEMRSAALATVHEIRS